jgi:hypothetical protein
MYDFEQDGIGSTLCQPCMDMKESPAEIKSPAHWNLIGSSMTASCLFYPQ